MKGFRILLMAMAALTFGLHSAQAQDEDQEELSLDEGKIDSQFEFIYEKSGNYRSEGKRYEVVRTISLDKLRQNVLDTLDGFNKRVSELKTTIAGNESTISSLEKKLEDTTNSLAAVTEEKDNMSFLGIDVSKGTYNAILWTIIASL